MHGKDLEKTANLKNIEYAKQKLALILKIPVPIEITSRGPIPRPSTVDFAGLIIGGKFIAFDAKETQNTNSFPLQNIHDHQLNYLLKVHELGGIAFFLIHFTKIDSNKAFRVPVNFIKQKWDAWQNGGKASIKYHEFPLEYKVKLSNYLDDYVNPSIKQP